MMEYTGACRFCGQLKMVKGGDGLTQEEVDRLAALECACDDAQYFQMIERKKAYAEANIRKVLETDGENVRAACMGMVQQLAEQKIRKISLQTDNGINITMTAKEKSIRIERKETKKTAMED